MNIEQVIKLLKKRTTTVENILTSLSEMVQQYQDDQQDLYIQQFGERMEIEGINPTEIDLDSQTDKINQQVQKDTKVFIKKYVASMTDEVLDAINDKKVKKQSGFCFLTMLAALQEAFEVN